MRKNAYLNRLRNDIDRWTSTGLIDARLGDRLFASAAENDAPTEANSTILPALAAFTVMLGIFTLIAANWSGLTGVWRIAILFVFLGATSLGAGWARHHQQNAISNFAGVIAAAIAGGGLIVIGQLYHTEAASSAFLSAWTIGALIVSVLVATPLGMALTAALTVAWTLSHFVETPRLFSDTYNGFIGPFWAIPVWLVIGWRAAANRTLGIVHLLIIGASIWISPVLLDIAKWMANSDFGAAVALVILWSAIAAASEFALRIKPIWAVRTLSGWATWIGSIGLVSLTYWDRVEPKFFTPVEAPLAALTIFSILTAYGAAPGRRWLRGAGVTGFIATALIVFTAVDNMIAAGIALIGFGAVLTLLLFVTNRMLNKARQEQTGMEATS